MANNSKNLCNIGYSYLYGKNGYPLNYKNAFENFSQAAVAGNSDAMYYLGVMYANGYYVAKDVHKAIAWFDKALTASDYKDAYAAYNLACYYYDGVGVAQDIDRAYKLFSASALLGAADKISIFPQACYFTGVILMNRYKRYDEAVTYFVEAAKNGNIPEAWHNLGYLCKRGAMKEISKSQINGTAIGFYEKAAELGYVQSMDAAGRLYHISSMPNEALYWTEKAANLGYAPAKKRLKMLKVAQGGSLWNLFR